VVAVREVAAQETLVPMRWKVAAAVNPDSHARIGTSGV
jgi:hypothetical protein